MNLFDESGIECDFEYSIIFRELSEAIKRIPNAEAYGDTSFEDEAFALWVVAQQGFDLEKQRDRKQTFWPSEKNMRDLDLLAEGMERLYKPAFKRLSAEIAPEDEMRAALRLVREMARAVFYDLDQNVPARGQPKKEAAAKVTEAAARIYHEIANRWPTYTTSERNVSTTLRQWPLEFRLGFLRLVLVD